VHLQIEDDLGARNPYQHLKFKKKRYSTAISDMINEDEPITE